MDFKLKTDKRIDVKLFKKLLFNFRHNLKISFFRIEEYRQHFLKNDKRRLAGSTSFSLIIHVLLITVYFGLVKLDKPIEPPIREISFFDLTEEIVEDIKPKKVFSKKKEEKDFFIRPQPELAVYTDVKQPEKSVTFGEDRLFLDTERKQVPIKIERFESVANNIVNKDVLLISPAKGLKKDDRIARPIKIDLNKGKNLIFGPNSEKRDNFAIIKNVNAEIDLKGEILQNPTAMPVSELKSTPPRIDLNDNGFKIKSAQTNITGPLANRAILNKTIPPFPFWAKKQGVGAVISIRFTVMEDGIVKENIIVERTSGSSDWDRLVVRALKQWKFAALDKGAIHNDQTGSITFQFII